MSEDSGSRSDFESAKARLLEAAQWTESVLDRLLGLVRGLQDNQSAGDLPDGWIEDPSSVEPQQLIAMAAHLEASAERARQARSGLIEASMDPKPVSFAAQQHAGEALPLVRNEVHYMATVLPQLLAADDFRHLHLFLTLCGLPKDAWPPSTQPIDEYTQLQFFSEYNFSRAVYTPTDREVWGDIPAADTPDLVIAGPDWLLVVEGKMYLSTTRAALDEQIKRQSVHVQRWARTLRLPPDRVRHVLLLPDRLAQLRPQAPVVTWGRVIEAYEPIAPKYWIGMLRTALDRDLELQSLPVNSELNSDEKLSGQAILDAHSDDPGDIRWVGRFRGASGPEFVADVATGAWKTRLYEINRTASAPPNNNWMSIEVFVAEVAGGS